jgi:hypothetical protein
MYADFGEGAGCFGAWRDKFQKLGWNHTLKIEEHDFFFADERKIGVQIAYS